MEGECNHAGRKFLSAVLIFLFLFLFFFLVSFLDRYLSFTGDQVPATNKQASSGGQLKGEFNSGMLDECNPPKRMRALV